MLTSTIAVSPVPKQSCSCEAAARASRDGAGGGAGGEDVAGEERKALVEHLVPVGKLDRSSQVPA